MIPTERSSLFLVFWVGLKFSCNKKPHSFIMLLSNRKNRPPCWTFRQRQGLAGDVFAGTVQCSTELDLFRLTAAGITNSSTHNDLTIRITAPNTYAHTSWMLGKVRSIVAVWERTEKVMMSNSRTGFTVIEVQTLLSFTWYQNSKHWNLVF